MVRGFKIGVTRWFRANMGIPIVWQRNYYEHVIRDDGECTRIREYVAANPARWEQDEENPAVARDSSEPDGEPWRSSNVGR